MFPTVIRTDDESSSGIGYLPTTWYPTTSHPRDGNPWHGIPHDVVLSGGSWAHDIRRGASHHTMPKGHNAIDAEGAHVHSTAASSDTGSIGSSMKPIAPKLSATSAVRCGCSMYLQHTLAYQCHGPIPSPRESHGVAAQRSACNAAKSDVPPTKTSSLLPPSRFPTPHTDPSPRRCMQVQASTSASARPHSRPAGLNTQGNRATHTKKKIIASEPVKPTLRHSRYLPGAPKARHQA